MPHLLPHPDQADHSLHPPLTVENLTVCFHNLPIRHKCLRKVTLSLYRKREAGNAHKAFPWC